MTSMGETTATASVAPAARPAERSERAQETEKDGSNIRPTAFPRGFGPKADSGTGLTQKSLATREFAICVGQETLVGYCRRMQGKRRQSRSFRRGVATLY